MTEAFVCEGRLEVLVNVSCIYFISRYIEQGIWSQRRPLGPHVDPRKFEMELELSM